LSALSQFSTPTLFVRFSSTSSVCHLDFCFQSSFCFGHRFSILRCLFSFHRVLVHSSVQDLPDLCFPFHSPSIWGSSVLPAESWFWISPLVRAWASYNSRSVYVLLQPDSRSSCQAEVVRCLLKILPWPRFLFCRPRSRNRGLMILLLC
jgi:hypothetical protein